MRLIGLAVVLALTLAPLVVEAADREGVPGRSIVDREPSLRTPLPSL